MNAPLVSVCILAHNDAAYIATAIQSVLGQSFANWEMLIADDASSDGTGQLVQSYLSDPRIRYIRHQDNVGQASNWAFAISVTQAPYIATLHADDAWERNTLITFVNAFQNETELDLVWANWDYYDAALSRRLRSAPVTRSQEWSGVDACSWLVRNNHALPSASAFSRAVTRRAGLPDIRYGMLCDRDYFLRLSLASGRCQARREIVARYRCNQQGVTSEFTRSGRFQEEMLKFAENVDGLLETHPKRHRLCKELRRVLGQQLFVEGLQAVVDGRSAVGKRWASAGLNLAGGSVINPSTMRCLARICWRKWPFPS